MSEMNVPSAPGYDDIIREHYAQEARAHGAMPTSTMADEIVRAKETNAILTAVTGFIQEQTARDAAEGKSTTDRRFHIVDLGCGNGTTLELLASKIASSGVVFTGVEYTEDLRTIAQERLRAFGNVKVVPGDVRLIHAGACDPADVIILQRVLINLLDRADQKHALGNIVNLLKPGGLLFAIEAFEPGLSELNAARAECALPPLPPAHHNLYLADGFFDHPQLAQASADESRGITENLLSTHYFVTRVLHAAFLQATGGAFKRNSHFVKFFSAALPDGIGAYSPLKFIARRKITQTPRGPGA